MAEMYAGEGDPVGGDSAPMINRGAAPELEDFADETEARGNVIDLLTEDQISHAGKSALDGYRIDQQSNQEWEEEAKRALALMSRLSDKDGGAGPGMATKSYPFEGASNVIWPIIQEAATQFHGRCYPAVIQGADVVKAKIRGRDPDDAKLKRGERVALHMSDQLLEQSPDWEPDHDTLLIQLPVVGQAFTKPSWIVEENRPDAPLISALNVKVNRLTRSLRSCPRITEEIPTYPYEIAERMNVGRYREIDLGLGQAEDEQEPQPLLESHIRIDLDGDGYPEPWIVTMHENGTVLAIAAGWTRNDIRRDVQQVPMEVFDVYGNPTVQMVEQPGDLLLVRRKQYYVGYSFMPDPAGGFYGLGFARLLAHPQAAVNAVINQIIDGAKYQNGGGGLIGRGVSFNAKGGQVRMNPTIWQTMTSSGDDIRKAIVPWASVHPGPSPTLFQVLGLLLEMAKKTSFMADVLTGDVPHQQPVGTTLAQIEQGLQVFGSAFKRIYRSLKNEYTLIYDLNSRFLSQEAYAEVVDDPEANVETDYSEQGFDLSPVADPTQVTAMQRLALAQYLMQFYGQPDSNNVEIKKFALTAARVENPERFISEPQGPPPEVQAKVKLELMEQAAKVGKVIADTIERRTAAIKNIADAESKEAGVQLQEYMGFMNMIANMVGGPNADSAAARPNGMGGLVAGPGGGGVPALPGQPPGGMPGGMGGPAPLGPQGPGPGAPAAGAIGPGPNGAGA